MARRQPDPGALSGPLAGVSFAASLVALNALSDAPYPMPGAEPPAIRRYVSQEHRAARLGAVAQLASAASLGRFTASVAALAARSQPGHLADRRQGQVMKLGGAQRRPRQPGLRHYGLGRQLGREVAEQRAVDAADDRDPVGADDRDVHQVRCPGPRRGLHQVARLVLVALAAAGTVHDDLGTVDRGLDPLAGGQVAGHEVGALAGFATAPGEHPHRAAGGLQPRDYEAPERAGTAGDQDRAGFVIAPCGAAHGLLSPGSAVSR